MQVVSRYPNGIFCWVDLSTTDPAAAKEFYSGLFGWEFEDRPTGMGGSYTMCLLEGKSVAGLGPMPPDMQSQGIPPHWSSYIKHDDADAVAQKVSEAGGTVVMPPMDVMEEGRMFVAQDPTGGTFGVWQPKNHIGAELVNRPSALVWNELQTRDAEKALDFYSTVFGWGHDTDPNGYHLFKLDDRIHAGMMQMDDSWGDVPPNWAVYFMTEDIEATSNKASELGGRLLVPVTQAGEMGKFAVIQDPQSAVFTAMQFDGPVDAPPGY